MMLGGWACRNTTLVEELQHPPYFDPVFRQAETLVAAGSGRVPAMLDSAFIAFPAPGLLDLYRKYMYLSVYYVENLRDFDVALVYADSAVQLIRKEAAQEKLATEYAQALFRKGYVLMELRRYADCFRNYNMARQIIEHSGDSCSLSEYTFMLASVCDLQRNNLEAARYVKKGVQELGHCDTSYANFKLMAGRLDDIGIFYSRSDMPDSALYYFNASLAYMQRHRAMYQSNPRTPRFVELLSGIVYGNMGTAYAKKGDSATAEKLFLESLRITTKKEYHHGDALYTWAKLASLYLAKNRLADAGSMLDEMRTSLDTIPDLANEVKWYRLRFDYLQKTGRPVQMAGHVGNYLRLQDSLTKRATLPVTDVNKDYEALKDGFELALLEKKAQVNNLYLAIVIGLSAVAIFIALFLWYHWQRVRKLHALTVQQNSHLQKALGDLEKSQEDNTRMMKIAAHDLRNPVGGMTSAASIMLDEPGRSDDDRMMLGLIKTSGEHAMELVSDLLQVQVKGEKLEKEPVDLAQMLAYCVELLRHKAGEKRQQILLETKPATLPVNREKMWRVVSNLIANAIKFSPAGANIVVQLQSTEYGGLITVKDQGIGIPEEIQGRIFELFTTAKRMGTAGEQPFGLGLAISRQIVEAHGGSIWFDTQTGKGTTFFVELPLSG